ncbi:hypothetical protein E1286_25960, partial [Nonomuraea terrae]
PQTPVPTEDPAQIPGPTDPRLQTQQSHGTRHQPTSAAHSRFQNQISLKPGPRIPETWRISPSADYVLLNTFARGKIGLRKIRRNWEGILRVVASVYTGHRPRLRRRHHAPA